MKGTHTVECIDACYTWGIAQRLHGTVNKAMKTKMSKQWGTTTGSISEDHIRSLGHAVVQLVEALCYKLEGRGFDSRWCHRIFSSTYSFRPHYGPEVDSASNRNEYQEYFLGVKAASA